MRRKTVIEAINRALFALRKTKPILQLAIITAFTKFLAACTDTTGTSEDDNLVGSKDADLFVSSLGADTFDGADGVDAVDYSNSNGAVVAYLDGRVGKGYFSEGDVISNIENLVGSNYHDILVGNDKDNHIEGLEGNDTIIGGRGADILKGGAGVDLLDYSLSEIGITVSLLTGLGKGGDAEGDLVFGFENLIATQHNDTIEGDDQNNTIIGGAGDDIIDGGGGDDIIKGGAGRDALKGGTGVDMVSYVSSNATVRINLTTGIGLGGDAQGDSLTGFENIEGSLYDDFIWGDGADNIIYGFSGNDYLVGYAGGDRIDGGDGVDSVDYNASNSHVEINLKDIVFAGGHAQGDELVNVENIIGSNFNDIIQGNDSDNQLLGGKGDDVLVGFGGADHLDGGDGIDTVRYTTSALAVTVDLRTNSGTTGDATGDRIVNVENIIGSDYSDHLIGDGGVNYLYGGAGEDRLEGYAGDDVFIGGAGSDTIYGGEGRDWANYESSTAAVIIDLRGALGLGGDSAGDQLFDVENVNGTQFADIVIGSDVVNHITTNEGDDILAGLGGADILDGGTGNDTASYSLADSAVEVHLMDGAGFNSDAQGDTLISIENIIGSNWADTLIGDDGVNVIAAGDGDDRLSGLGGADILKGGEGSDSADYSASAVGVSINLLDNIAQNGDAQGDVFYSVENLVGSAYDDLLMGDDADNILIGGIGNDVLRGNLGADTINGGAGQDTANYENSNGAVFIDLLNMTGTGGHATGDYLEDIESVTGSQFDDRLFGDIKNNVLIGGAGDDILSGHEGSDDIYGGDGIDAADYSLSDIGVHIDLVNNVGTGGHATGDILHDIENIIGSHHDDIIIGNATENNLIGGFGNDILAGHLGADILNGGVGLDAADYTLSNEAVIVRMGAGIILGGHAAGDQFIDIENVTGSTFDDILEGDDTDNLLNGGSGDDVLAGLLGADILEGGNGNDIADYELSNLGVNVSLFAQTADGGHATGDELLNIEGLKGSNLVDYLTGDENANQLFGNEGNDILQGHAGADELHGGAGVDTATYALSNQGVAINLLALTNSGGHATGDEFTSIENVTGSNHSDQLAGDNGVNVLNGGAGDDLLVGNGGADILDGGDGFDTVDYSNSLGNVSVNLAFEMGMFHDAEGDVLINIEKAIGSNFDDTLSGREEATTLMGLAGDDTLLGKNQNDILVGGDGDDTLLGAGGNDLLNGGAQHDSLLGGEGDDQLFGGGGDDLLSGNNGNDVLKGDAGGDILKGGRGDDLIYGGAGNDAVEGGQGQDILFFEDVSNISYGIQKNSNKIEISYIKNGLTEVDNLKSVETVIFQAGGTVASSKDMKSLWNVLDVADQAQFNNDDAEFLTWITAGYEYEFI